MNYVFADLFSDQPSAPAGFRTQILVPNGPFVSNVSTSLDPAKVAAAADEASENGWDICWDVEHISPMMPDNVTPNDADFFAKIATATAMVKAIDSDVRCFVYPLAIDDDIFIGNIMRDDVPRYEAWKARQEAMASSWNHYRTADGIDLNGYMLDGWTLADFLFNQEAYWDQMAQFYTAYGTELLATLTSRLSPIDYLNPTASPFIPYTDMIRIRTSALAHASGILYWHADTTFLWTKILRYPHVHAALYGGYLPTSVRIAAPHPHLYRKDTHLMPSALTAGIRMGGGSIS